MITFIFLEFNLFLCLFVAGFLEMSQKTKKRVFSVSFTQYVLSPDLSNPRLALVASQNGIFSGSLFQTNYARDFTSSVNNGRKQMK